MRYRQIDSRTGEPQTWRRWNAISNPNAPTQSGGTRPLTLGSFKSVQDLVTSRFRERVASGEAVNNPFFLSHSEVATEHKGIKFIKLNDGGPGDHGYYQLNGSLWGAGPHNILAYAAQARASAGLDALVERAKERVATETLSKKGQGGIDGLTFAGELKSTLELLRNPFATGLKLASAIERKLSRNLAEPWKPGLLAKRYDLRQSGSVPKEIANLSLEYMYGLRPLVREVEEILDRLQNGFKERTPRERVGAKESFVQEVSFASAWKQSEFSGTANVHSTLSIDVSAGSLYHFYHDLDATNRNWGIRLTDVPSAAWQLMPSSFVVDWFLGVNSFIKAMTPIAGLQTDAEWITVHKTAVTTVFNTGWALWSVPGWSVESGGDGVTYLTTKEIHRVPANLVPSLTRTRVSEGVKALSLGQSAGLLALFTQKCEPLVREFAPIFFRGRRS